MAAHVNDYPSPPPSPILYEGQGEENAAQLSEEAILDQLFMSCVTNDDSAPVEDDSAPVEDIITKVRGVVSAENQGYVLELFDRMMRDSATDGCINFSSFQHVIQLWVEAVKQQRSAPSSPHSQSSLSISQMSESSHSEVDYDNSAMGHTGHNFTLETSGGESFIDQQNDLAHSVQQLEYDNDRLSERNHELQLQMESSEERMADMASENEELMRKLRQTQQTLDQRNSLIDDMRKELDHLRHQDDTVQQLEKEIKRLQEDLTNANLQLEQLKQEVVRMEQLQPEHSIQEESHDDNSMQNIKLQLEEVESQNENLTAAINDLNETNEVLRVEKQEAVARVTELELELASRPVSQIPIYASTPYNVTARCLKDEIDDNLPSYNNNSSLENTDTSFYGVKKEEDSVDRLLGSLSPIPVESHEISSLDHFSIITSQARTQFRQKKELAMKQIAELFAADPSNNMETRKETLRQQLEDEMQSFEGKLSQLSQSKHISEKRVGRLIDYIKKLKAEIKLLMSEKGEAAPATSTEPDSVPEASEDSVSQLEKELADTKVELQKLTCDIEQMNSTIKKQKKELQKSAKQEEAERVTIATLTKDLSIANAKCVQLEDSLDVTVQRHREELDDIMELVLAETAKADEKLPAALSSSIRDDGNHGERSLPPTSERIKELVSTTINRILSALSLSSGNLKLLKWADGAQMSQVDSDDDDSINIHPKVITPSEQCNRNQSITEQTFLLSHQQPSSLESTESASDDTSKPTDHFARKRVKLVYQKMSIDEESDSLDQSLDDKPPDEQSPGDKALHEQSTDHLDQPLESNEQLPEQQTEGQVSHDQTSDQASLDLPLDDHKSHDPQPADTRSPSFVSLSSEGATVTVSKRRKAVVLQQPILEEASSLEDSSKEDDSNVNGTTPSGESSESDSRGHGKEETDTAPNFLQAGLQQQRSLSVPSYPQHLKSILRRSNAPKSLSLDVHNESTDDAHGRPFPLQHKLSVQFTESHQTVTVTPLSSTWEGHHPWMAVSPGTPYPLPALSSPPPISISETRELSFLSEDTEDIDTLSAEVVASRVKNLLVAMDTDNYTLKRRREVYLHAKETAIEDTGEELESLSEGLTAIIPSTIPAEQQQQITKHLDILSQSIKVVATKAEQHGCLLQEHHYSLCTKLIKRHLSNLNAAKESLEAQLAVCLSPDDRRRSRSMSCASARSLSSNDSGSLPRLYSSSLVYTAANVESSEASPPSSPEPADHLDNIQAIAYQKGMDTGLQYNLDNLKQREKECVAKCRSLTDTMTKIQNNQQKIVLAKEKTETKQIWSQLITLAHMILLLLLLALLVLSCVGTIVWINDEDRSVYCSQWAYYNRYPLAHIFDYLGIDVATTLLPL